MKPGLTVLEYVRADGSNPYRKWFDGLAAQAAAKVAVAVMRIELGNTSRIKWIRAIAEYRIDWGPGYRIYLGRDGDKLIILLGGGMKQRQQQDIQRAVAMWTEYNLRKAAAAKRKNKKELP